MKDTKKNKILARFALASAIIVFMFAVSACSKQPEIDMNALGTNGKYNYHNDDLGFSIILPPEFIYYQTQRNNTADYNDLEFYVPTSDTAYAQEVPGYAKPIVIRVYNKDAWDKIANKDAALNNLGEKNGKVYLIRFWDKVPSDWKNKWTDTMKKDITSSIKIL